MKFIVLIFASLFIMPNLSAQSRGQFIKVNGKKIWYQTVGSGEPLLLVPGGGGGSHDYFYPYFSKLTDSFQVIYYDAFGRGLSERTKNLKEYTFERDVDEIEGLRKALGLGKINILGHSFSGATVQAYAVKYPNSVNKIILMDPLTTGKAYQELTDRFNQQIADLFPSIDSTVKAVRAKGLKSSHIEHQMAYLDHFENIFSFFYFFDHNQPPLVWDSITFNPDVYYALAGDDADFVIGGDVKNLDFTAKLKKLSNPIL
ncbi:alpha/beta hydrolase, partial [bacterium]|nr:alpha/beta hydrolase [bacterium]